jgi:hypothetical protein
MPETQPTRNRNMWLTVFDVPRLHTMYGDNPLRGHNLMQVIARVTRVLKNIPGGIPFARTVLDTVNEEYNEGQQFLFARANTVFSEVRFTAAQFNRARLSSS